MRRFRTLVLTGIAALAAVGVGLAAGRDVHVMKVSLPDGSVARIEYRGDLAPKIMIGSAPEAMPVGFAGSLDDSSLAPLNQLLAEMDRRTEALIHEAGALEALSPPDTGKLDLAALREMPAGTVHYQFVSMSEGGRTCDRAIEVTSYGSGAKPRIVSSSSGDCAPAARALTPAGVDRALDQRRPDVRNGEATPSANGARRAVVA